MTKIGKRCCSHFRTAGPDTGPGRGVRIVQLVKVSEFRVIGIGISITKKVLQNAQALGGGCAAPIQVGVS